jgi:hypothetical protein
MHEGFRIYEMQRTMDMWTDHRDGSQPVFAIKGLIDAPQCILG